MKTQKNTYLLLLIIAALLSVGCSQEPAKIHYNHDECAHCKMMISDNKFAAQLVTTKGKAIKFDAIECLAAYEKDQGASPEAKRWVTDYNSPGSWVEAGEAVFIKSEVVKSPMGASLLALSDSQNAKQHLDEKTGKMISWKQIMDADMNNGRHSGTMEHHPKGMQN